MLNPDYLDMLSAFEDEKVECLAVGAYALAAHGAPRATGDLDLWIRPTPENADRAFRALEVFGAPTHDLTVSDLADPGFVFQVGVEPRRIDIRSSITGVSFDETWREREQVEINGLSSPILGPAQLVENKRALGQNQDLADIERMAENWTADQVGIARPERPAEKWATDYTHASPGSGISR